MRSTRITRIAAALLAIGLSLLACRGASAVAIVGGGNTDPTSFPAGNLFYDVGTRGPANASGVYLGNGWVLTAGHVTIQAGYGFTFTDPTTLTSNSYSVALNGGTPITMSVGSGVDLQLVKLAQNPTNLPAITIASTPPPAGAELLYVGAGVANLSPAYWNVTVNSANSYTWTPLGSAPGSVTPIPANPNVGSTYQAGGFNLDSNPGTVRWGENIQLASSPFAIGAGYAPGPNTSVLFSNFYDSTYAPLGAFQSLQTAIGTNEAQVGSGDSGGAVLYFNSTDSKWELAGTILTVATFPDSPTNTTNADTAIFGEDSYFASLATYRSTILEIVPEPSAWLLGLLGAGGLLAAGRRLAGRGARPKTP